MSAERSYAAKSAVCKVSGTPRATRTKLPSMSGGSNRSLWPTKLLPLRCSRADVPGPEPEDEGGARPNRLTSSIQPGEKDEEKATLARREQRQLSSGRELICTY
jgi:hypothetical protein